MSTTYQPWSVEKAATALRDNFLGGDVNTELTSWIAELLVDDNSKALVALVVQVLKDQDVDAINTAEEVLMDACTAIAVTHLDRVQELFDEDYPEAEGVVFS